ncbi:Slp family lipoprotein [Thalassomonas sp. RHCl1]|uniref:Slp family lipoprotein n=1 Tax=Thalassomonas sp. RHCl1 TaxID=2995320 RepID=UPI00248C5660|nr:Slp family lipoprotein [Thalassomonas sp. RHCl1]
MKKLFVCFSALVLTACSAIPEKLQLAPDTPLTNYKDALAVSYSDAVAQARWGGVIAKVDNLKDSTRIEVVHFELSPSTRPKQKDETLGRFRVYYPGLLDPMIYKKGKSITVVGNIAAPESGTIGEHPYQYPVVKADAVHLWKDIQQADVMLVQNPFWHTPSYWHHYNPYGHHPVVIRRSSNGKKSSSAGNKTQKKTR